MVYYRKIKSLARKLIRLHYFYDLKRLNVMNFKKLIYSSSYFIILVPGSDPLFDGRDGKLCGKVSCTAAVYKKSKHKLFI